MTDDLFPQMGAAGRRASRERKYGPGSVCMDCGRGDLDSLMHDGRTVLEDDHVLGRKFAREVIDVVCRDCHAIRHERRRTKGFVLREQPTFLDTLSAALRNHSITLGDYSDVVDRWSKDAHAFRVYLDAKWPRWRKWGPTR
jgi:hypothetical protein